MKRQKMSGVMENLTSGFTAKLAPSHPNTVEKPIHNAFVEYMWQQVRAFTAKPSSTAGQAAKAAFVRGALSVAIECGKLREEQVSAVQFLCAVDRFDEACRLIEGCVKGES